MKVVVSGLVLYGVLLAVATATTASPIVIVGWTSWLGAVLIVARVLTVARRAVNPPAVGTRGGYPTGGR